MNVHSNIVFIEAFYWLIELYNQNLTTAEIAEKLGCSLSNISRRLKKAGISYKRDYSKRAQENWRRVQCRNTSGRWIRQQGMGICFSW